MESVNHICDCLSGFTEAEKMKADAVAGGSFEKILVELQLLRNSFGEKNSFSLSGNQEKTTRASEILDIFFLQQKIEKESEPLAFDPDAPLDLESLRWDPGAKREVPVFLEKQFELFGSTLISKFI